MFRATTDGFNARQRHVHSMTWDGYNATQSLGPQHRGGATADDARPAKVARLSPPGYFQQYNFDDRGRVLDECSMHALNSTLVNCLDRPPVEKWSTSGIPQEVVTGYRKLKSGKMRALKDNLWFPSDRQLANQNQVSANWAYLFDHLDPGGKNVTLRGVDFHQWALDGVADAKFKYAVAQLPAVANSAHAVSIIRAKDSGDLVLVDSNLRGTRKLRDVALQDKDRWSMFPGAYIVIREKL
jgi:hypothetical protein